MRIVKAVPLAKARHCNMHTTVGSQGHVIIQAAQTQYETSIPIADFNAMTEQAFVERVEMLTGMVHAHQGLQATQESGAV